MKQQVDPKVMAAVVVIVILAIVGIGWKMLSPKHESQGERDSYFAAHPEAKAAAENMHKMGANGPMTPGTVKPPPGVRTGGSVSP